MGHGNEWPKPKPVKENEDIERDTRGRVEKRSYFLRTPGDHNAAYHEHKYTWNPDGSCREVHTIDHLGDVHTGERKLTQEEAQRENLCSLGVQPLRRQNGRRSMRRYKDAAREAGRAGLERVLASRRC
jgi:hypothetical protein